MHAEICPVCQGSGNQTIKELERNIEVICNGCTGKGWIEVSDDNTQENNKNVDSLLCEVPPNQRELMLNE